MTTPPSQAPEPEVLLTPAEVARAWRVDSKTVVRWAKAKVLPPSAVIRTPGGHRRYRLSVLRQTYPDVFRNGDGPE